MIGHISGVVADALPTRRLNTAQHA